jgi:hypothetical protein
MRRCCAFLARPPQVGIGVGDLLPELGIGRLHERVQRGLVLFPSL